MLFASPLLALLQGLDNGAANTPPMGWCSWQRYRCARACNDGTSLDCFNERLIKDTADALVSSGLRDAGFELVTACGEIRHGGWSDSLVKTSSTADADDALAYCGRTDASLQLLTRGFQAYSRPMRI